MCFSVLGRPGDDLLSRVLRQSTIGAKAFDGRVRDGIGSGRLARATRPAKNGLDDEVDGRQQGFCLPGPVHPVSGPNEAKLELDERDERGGGFPSSARSSAIFERLSPAG